MKRILASLKGILATFAPVAVGVAAAAVFTALPASASTQFTATFIRGNLIQTSQHLHVGEVLRQGLDGEAFTVISQENLGGTTLAHVSPGFSRVLDGRTVVVTAS